MPAAAEEIVVARDMALAELTGGRLHICHVEHGRRGRRRSGAAKARGVRVTAEVTPHHLALTDELGRRRPLGGPRLAVRHEPAR